MNSAAVPEGHQGFLGNVVRLGSGQMVALALPILAAPALGRLYGPADYGALALFMAATGMLSVLAALQMQHGIIAARTEHAARVLVWLCVFLAFGLAIVVLAGLLIATLAGAPVTWMWLLPFSITIAGLMAGVTTLANRKGRYSTLAQLQAASVIATIAGSLICGYLGWGQSGLFAGYMLGQAVNLGYCLYLWRPMIGATPPSLRRLCAVGLRHRRFALFTLPAELLGSWNQHLPIFALATLGAAPSLGAFARARRLAGVPVALIGSATGQVFRAEAAIRWRRSGSCRALYLRTAAGLFMTGIIPCLLLIWTAPVLFTLYLGPEWDEAGRIAQFLAPMLLLRLAVSPVSSVFQITGRQRLVFGLSLLAAGMIGVGVGLPLLCGAPPLSVITGFASAYAAVYSLYFVVGLRVSGP